MLIKERHPNDAIALLEERKSKEWRNRKALDQEIKNIRAGAKGEQTAAYFIDFDYKNSENWAVIHDLRIEHNGRVAQIDHLLISRALFFYVLESKHFSSKLRITANGEFERFITDTQEWEGIESPLAQNRRHIAVLEDLVASEGLLPKRLGMQLKPTFKHLVLVSGKATIARPEAKDFDTSRVVKSDVFRERIGQDMDAIKGVDVLAKFTQVVSSDTVRSIAQGLVRFHRPSRYSGAIPPQTQPPLEQITPLPPEVQQRVEPSFARPVDRPTIPSPANRAPVVAEPSCKACHKLRLEIQYGKFGYYWKCLDCGGNTKLLLPGEGRIRKDGTRFYFTPAGGAEVLFHVNGEI